MKAILGAVLNIKNTIAELLLGIPPLEIQTKIHCIKHFLKINNTPVQSDSYRKFLIDAYDHETKTPKAIFRKYKDVYEFLEWKLASYPSHFNNEDKYIVINKEYNKFPEFSEKSCSYTQNMMKKYTEILWSSTMKNQFQLDGYPSPPIASCEMLQIPRNTTRETEVQVTSLFYKNNLLNQSLYNIGNVPSPLCSYCQLEEETSDHLLFRCAFVEEQLKLDAKAAYKSALNLCENDAEPDIYIGLLNASRSDKFIKCCTDIVRCLNIKVLVDF